MKRMLINKIGYEHSQEWKNCQDFGFINEKVKCVVDGCSEGEHSEVGAKLFCHLFEKNENVQEVFEQLTSVFSDYESIRNHLLFTILYVTETEDEFHVFVAGDGYIIKQDHEDKISYECIDNENSPAYFAYNFVPKQYLRKYQEGVDFNVYSFSKSEYKAIGVATDGLQYLLRSDLKEQFENFIVERKLNRIRLLINKEHKIFKDDISIAI